MSVAHYITLSRIFLSPLFFFIYLDPSFFSIQPTHVPYILLVLLALAELSDAVDGYVARQLNQVTDLGKILDPMADSIYRITIFLTFTLPPVNLPMYLIFILIYRDSIISTLRTVCALKGFALGARISGKIKAILQGFATLAMTLLLIPFSLGQLSAESLHDYATYIVASTAVYTLLSGVDYLIAHWKIIQTTLILSKVK